MVGDNGTLTLWDYNTGTAFQNMDDIPQPGSLEAEAGVFCSTFDATGTRLITGGADKTIKVRCSSDNSNGFSDEFPRRSTLSSRSSFGHVDYVLLFSSVIPLAFGEMSSFVVSSYLEALLGESVETQ